MVLTNTVQVTALVSTALNSVAIAHALGSHMDCLTTPGKLNAMQWELDGLIPGALSAPLARISFCFYLLPFGGLCKKWKACFWTIIISQTLVNIVCMVGAMVTCGLSSAHWDLEHGSICWAPSVMVKISFAQGGMCYSTASSAPTDTFLAFNAATDLILTIMPFLILRNLKMARSTKIALPILLGMSIITMAACILKTVELYHLSESKDITYDTAQFMIWLALERYLAVIAVSVPTLRPLALYVLRDRLKWFRTPIDHSDQVHGDRTWVSRNPTRFTFDTDVQPFDGRRSMSLPRPPAQMTDEDLSQLASFLNELPLRIPRRGASIKKTVTVERSVVERRDGEGFDRAYIEVSGLSRSAVGGPGVCLDGIWDD